MNYHFYFSNTTASDQSLTVQNNTAGVGWDISPRTDLTSPEPPAEREARERRDAAWREEERARQGHERAGRAAAEARAKALARRLIPPELFQRAERGLPFDVLSRRWPGLVYRLPGRNYPGDMVEVAGEGQPVCKLCFGPRESLPDWDVVLSRYILCSWDEACVWQRAIVHDDRGRQGQRMKALMLAERREKGLTW